MRRRLNLESVAAGVFCLSAPSAVTSALLGVWQSSGQWWATAGVVALVAIVSALTWGSAD